jgi:PhzF family phenazine biosynthesis protein
MMKIEVAIINAFTTNNSGGNPAGVVLNADNLSPAQMQKVARQVGLSETAFVTQSEIADYQVRFFTTTDEVDFCGHATLATFYWLKHCALIAAGDYQQSTKAGLLGVSVLGDDTVIMQQQVAEYGALFESNEIAAMLNIDPSIIANTGLPIQVVSTGLPDVIVPVLSGYLDLIVPNQQAITELCKKHALVSLHVFELFAQDMEHFASCRNFAPLYGIPEESATGSASGALACYFNKYLDLSISQFSFEQGRVMDARSVISAKIKNTAVEVAGTASFVSKQLVLL